MSRILDRDNPEWTEKDFKRSKPASEIFPQIVRKGRGPQKVSPKVSTTVRLDQEVIDYFKSTGRGWQRRLNNVLKKWIAGHRR
jgi:uncharacterized protein (DUF4415 family)